MLCVDIVNHDDSSLMVGALIAVAFLRDGELAVEVRIFEADGLPARDTLQVALHEHTRLVESIAAGHLEVERIVCSGYLAIA